MNLKFAADVTRSLISTATPPLALHLEDEFMDVSGRYLFRVYLGEHQPNDHAAAIVTHTLGKIATGNDNLSNAELYDAVHAKLCGPEPLDQMALLRFMNLFAAALRVELRHRAETAVTASKWLSSSGTIPSETTSHVEAPPTGSNLRASVTTAGDLLSDSESHTTFDFAIINPKATLLRLMRYDSCASVDKDAALVYELADFVGCTDLEIARLLSRTLTEIQVLRADASNTIRK